VAGVLHGVGAGAGLRYTCHCDDCQAYAHHLGRADMLDDRGGTDAFQTNASRLEILRGLDKLASLRVANQPMRPAIRWYAACCATPLFASYDTAKRSFFVLLLANTDRAQCDALLPQTMGVVWRKFALADIGDRKDANLPAIVWRMMMREINARLTGDWRRTPLFDAATGEPISRPRQMTPDERAAAAASMAAWKAAREAATV
jgi:hypothetical protein